MNKSIMQYVNDYLAWEWNQISWCGVSSLRYYLMIKKKNSDEVDMQKLKRIALCFQFGIVLSIFVTQIVVLGFCFDAVRGSAAIQVLLYTIPVNMPLLLSTLISF